MKTKTTVGGFFALLSIITTVASASGAQPILVVKSAIALNDVPTAANLNSLPSKLMVADVNLAEVKKIGTAFQFEFQDAGHKVNVSNFRATKAESTLVYNGTNCWSGNLGLYHPADQGDPDYIALEANGNNVSPTSGRVSGRNGDNSGVLIASVSTFQVLNQIVLLGTGPGEWTPLSKAGDYYSLTYNWVFSYTYDGVTYTETLTAASTEAMVRVVSGVPAIPASAGSPVCVGVETSTDLQTWVVPEGVLAPLDCRDVQSMINLLPMAGVPQRYYRLNLCAIPASP